MADEIIGNHLHHHPPGPTARVKQATGRNGCRGGAIGHEAGQIR
jgi:hypothetical protein